MDTLAAKLVRTVEALLEDRKGMNWSQLDHEVLLELRADVEQAFARVICEERVAENDD